MNVFDTSALLAFLTGEPGADAVEEALQRPGSCCGAANWSELAQKVRQHGRDLELVRALLIGLGLTVAPVTLEDAEHAARLWHRGAGLSLGDRLCLALGERLDADVWTADRAWGSAGRVVQVRPAD